MRDVNNLLKRLKGIQRQVATHIILEVDRSRFKEATFTVDALSKKFYTNRSTIYFVIEKLLISEIVRLEDSKIGVYIFKRYNWQSFDQVARILEEEVKAHD